MPVKAFDKAKLRLAGALEPHEREELARDLAGRVVRSAGDLPVFVACDDERVATWATAHGACVVWTPRLGLSGAVSAGVAELHRQGFDMAIVCHADLPLITTLAGFGRDSEITFAPDRHLDGTNVACLPTGIGFHFHYGRASFPRHLEEAKRTGLVTRVVHDWQLACDLDVPDDLALMTRGG